MISIRLPLLLLLVNCTIFECKTVLIPTLGGEQTIPFECNTTIQKDGKNLTFADKFQKSQTHFTILNIQKEDLGEYTCFGTRRTLELRLEVPKAVKNLTITPSFQYFNVAWEFPYPTTGVDFQVLYQDVNQTQIANSITTTQLNTRITVAINTTYSISVNARNQQSGNGPKQSKQVATIPFRFPQLTLTTAEIQSKYIVINVRSGLPFVPQEIKGYKVKISIYKTNTEQLFNEKTLEKPAELKFEGLSPNTQYRFEAVQEVDGKKSFSDELNGIRTKEGVPSAPTNFQIREVESKSVTLNWGPPAQENGNVVAYRIRYTFLKKGQTIENITIVPATLNKKKVEGLYGFVDYTFTVAAKTIDFGPEASRTQKTSPSKPVAPENLQANDLNATSLQLSWNEIPDYLRGGVITSYQIIATDNNTCLSKNELKNTAVNTKFTFHNLCPYTSFEFKVRALTNQHEGSFVVTHHETPQAPPSAPTSVTLTAKRTDSHHVGIYQRVSHSFIIAWQPPKHPNGKIIGFEIQYWKKSSCRRCRRNTYRKYNIPVNFTSGPTRSYHLKNLDAYSLYALRVRERTIGWGEFSKTVENSTLEGNPSAPVNVTHRDLTYDSITIAWNPPLSPNGRIIYYSIIIKRDGNEERDLVTDFNQAAAAPSQFTINNLKSQTTYQIDLAAVVGTINRLRGDNQVLIITTPEEPAGFPWHFVLIGCLVTVLLLSVVIAIFLLLNRRRGRYSQVKREVDQTEMSLNKSKLIATHELKNYCTQLHANGDHGFQQEFESVRIPIHTYTWEHSQMPYNQPKNRYLNIVAYDHSRVILNQIDDDPGSTYINANFINGYQHQKKFIAAQGPLPETVLDFWRMVWEQNTPVIVMLTKLVEDKKIKCEQYWPEGKALQYKDIVVTTVSVNEYTDYIVRVFVLYKINNPELGKREVRQFHYMSWPDHGVPSHPASILSFVRHVMGYMNNRRQEGPTVVHCSAGVGRTGTFIAIETGLRQIEHDQSLDVYGTVCRMRMQRNFMVQVEAQYTFVYDALLDCVVCGNTELTPSELVAKIRFLEQVDPKTGKTNFHEEFKRLESGISTESGFGDANLSENKQKNRYLNILPYDHNRVKLVPIAGSRQSNYINASVVDGFQQKNAFIATQAPLENTVTDFWRMVQEKGVQIIVMLTRLQEKEQDKCYLYWPQGGTVCYGAIHVELVNVRENRDNIVIHELRLTNRESGKSWPVKHFLYKGWPDTGSPSTGTELINLIALVQKAQLSVEISGPILIHCSGGVGRTGVFIAVCTSIEKLRSNDVIDIFQTVRQLRLQRVAMVQTLDQYIFCYTAIKDYLDSFDLYTNPQFLIDRSTDNSVMA